MSMNYDSDMDNDYNHSFIGLQSLNNALSTMPVYLSYC